MLVVRSQPWRTEINIASAYVSSFSLTLTSKKAKSMLPALSLLIHWEVLPLGSYPHSSTPHFQADAR